MNKRKHRGPQLRKEFRQPDVAELKPKRSWFDRLAIFVVIILSLVMFNVHLKQSDYGKRKGMLTFDESVYTRLGFHIKEGEPYNVIQIYNDSMKIGRRLPSYVKDPLFKHPPMLPAMISVSYRFIERQFSYPFKDLYAYAVKAPALMGSLLILVTFLIGRRLYDYRVGLMAAFLISIDLNRWICSERVWIASTLTFFIWLSLYLLAWARENKWVFIPAGIAAGCAMLTKYPAVLIFVIAVTYALLCHREWFKQWQFYVFFILAGVVFLPWLIANINVYGDDFFNKMVWSQTAGGKRLKNFGNIMGIGSLCVLAGTVFWHYRAKFLANSEALKPKVVLGMKWILGLSVIFFILQKPFMTSIINSLKWTGVPRSGWDIGMFDKDPKYFYIKQMVEYSPFYLLGLAGLAVLPFKGKNNLYLLIAGLWIISFGIIYKDFQGRYMLYFAPAALLFAARMMILIHDYLSQKESHNAKIMLYSGYVLFVYFAFKTIRVDYLVAMKDNVAYF
jgi:4-amino-4-deoxy-L-arabinose transferase-like glycosyltransferase